MPVIRISPQMEKFLRSKGRFGDTHDSVLRRLLGLQPKHGQQGGRPGQGSGGKPGQAGGKRPDQNKHGQAGEKKPGNQNRPAAQNRPVSTQGGGQKNLVGQQQGKPQGTRHQGARPNKPGRQGGKQQTRPGQKKTQGRKQKGVTSPVVYRHVMLNMLLQAPEHKLQVGGLWPKIKKQMKKHLTPQDRAKKSAKGPLWKQGVAQAKKGLLKAGLVRHVKHGSAAAWQLTPRGVKWAKQLRGKKKAAKK